MSFRGAPGSSSNGPGATPSSLPFAETLAPAGAPAMRSFTTVGAGGALGATGGGGGALGATGGGGAVIAAVVVFCTIPLLVGAGRVFTNATAETTAAMPTTAASAAAIQTRERCCGTTSASAPRNVCAAGDA